MLPVCELERHSDDTHKRNLQKETLVITFFKLWMCFQTVDRLLLFLFPLRVDIFPQKAAMLPLYLLTFAGEYVLTVVPVLVHEGMFLLMPVAMIHTYHSLSPLCFFLCSKPPSKPTTSCCQAPATLSPTHADTRQMQTLPPGPCTKMVLGDFNISVDFFVVHS